MKGRFQSTKLIEGFSCCFRQEKSQPIHCSFLHGYALKFKVTFEGDLDYRNWVCDFGFMKRSVYTVAGLTLEGWFKYMFDHTCIVAADDTKLDWFIEADKDKILQLRVLDYVGCERFAELVYNSISAFIKKETNGRVKVTSVECFENDNNSAIYSE